MKIDVNDIEKYNELKNRIKKYEEQISILEKNKNNSIVRKDLRSSITRIINEDYDFNIIFDGKFELLIDLLINCLKNKIDEYNKEIDKMNCETNQNIGLKDDTLNITSMARIELLAKEKIQYCRQDVYFINYYNEINNCEFIKELVSLLKKYGKLK